MELAFHGRTCSLPEITRLQRMKTAALMTFCCESGAILGRASPSSREKLAAYGQELGLTFQIAADLDDFTGPVAKTSQVASSNENHNKATVVAVLGAERAQAQAEAMASQAAKHLDLFDEKADLLRNAAHFVTTRRSQGVFKASFK